MNRNPVKPTLRSRMRKWAGQEESFFLYDSVEARDAREDLYLYLQKWFSEIAEPGMKVYNYNTVNAQKPKNAQELQEKIYQSLGPSMHLMELIVKKGDDHRQVGYPIHSRWTDVGERYVICFDKEH